MIYIFTFLLAFCSIVYELLLGQTLSAFLGNTVLRYSVTIGLYMFSMGIGSLLAEGRFVKHPIISLLTVEVALTVLGGSSVMLLYFMDWAGVPALVFSITAHSMIIVIGLLTGFEIPLLIEVKRLETGDADNTVLGIDYLGAFLGTIVFAFLFYPIVGLVATAIIVALINAVVGILLFTQKNRIDGTMMRPYKVLIATQSVLAALLLLGLFNASSISEFLTGLYLRV